jgi:hypothetical protein
MFNNICFQKYPCYCTSFCVTVFITVVLPLEKLICFSQDLIRSFTFTNVVLFAQYMKGIDGQRRLYIFMYVPVSLSFTYSIYAGMFTALDVC